MDLLNKVAVVTGAARDIGRSIAKTLAANGAKVVIHYNNSDKEAVQTLEEITLSRGIASVFKGDLTKSGDVNRLVLHTLQTWNSGLDILVNNAGGILARKKLADIDEAFFDSVMDLNFKSVFLVTKAFLPHLNKGASIVNISSVAAREGGGGGSLIYASSKGALTTFTRGLAKELGPEGIRVNAVCPGLIDTRFHDLFTTDEIRQRVAGNTPLRREGSADEVADLVTFLASEKSSFITGANYDINGGIFFS